MQEFDKTHTDNCLKTARTSSRLTAVISQQPLSHLPVNLVSEARVNALVATCEKNVVVHDFITKSTKTYAVLGSSKSFGVMTGATLPMSCEHVVVGTSLGSLLTVSIARGTISTFSGASKVHDKPIVAITAITGRPSYQIHRSRIATACAGGIVAIWEVLCATPVAQIGVRTLTRNIVGYSPAVDLRFDSTRNRLVCSFGNGSCSVWGFDEQSQDETLLATVTKGLNSSLPSSQVAAVAASSSILFGMESFYALNSPQVAIPHGASGLPEDSLVTVNANHTKLVCILPALHAIKLARTIRKGVANIAAWDNKPPALVSDGIVAVRTLLDVGGVGGKCKIVKFWQHPLCENTYLLLCHDSSTVPLSPLNPNNTNTTLLWCTTNMEPAAVSYESPLSSNRTLVIVDNRLVLKYGSRFQSDRVVATLSPYLSPESAPQSIKDWSGDFKSDLLDHHPDRILEDLWPGPVSMSILTRDDNVTYVAFWWPDARKFVVTLLSHTSTPSSSTSSGRRYSTSNFGQAGSSSSAAAPMTGMDSLQVLQHGNCDAFSFFTHTDDQVYALVAHTQSLVASTATTLNAIHNPSGAGNFKMSLYSAIVRGGKSLNTFNTNPTASSKTTFRIKQGTLKTSATSQRTSLKDGKHTLTVRRVVSTAFQDTSAVLFTLDLDRPVDALVGNVGCGLFLARSPASGVLNKSCTRVLRLSMVDKKTSVVATLPRFCQASVWSHERLGLQITSTAIGFSDPAYRSAMVFDSSAEEKFKYRCSVFLKSLHPCVAIKWLNGSLLFATKERISIAFVGSTFKGEDPSRYVLAARGRDARPPLPASIPRHDNEQKRRESLHVHDEKSRPEDAAYAPSPSYLKAWEEPSRLDVTPSMFPAPWVRPYNDSLSLLGLDRESGDYLVSAPGGKVYLYSLAHPLIRVGVLAAAGFARAALKWSSNVTFTVEARDEAAMMFEKFGFHHEAAMVEGASLDLLLDVCIKNRLVDDVERIFQRATSSSLGKAFLRESHKTGDKLSPIERLALLLASGQKLDLIAKLVKHGNLSDRESTFCNALIAAKA